MNKILRLFVLVVFSLIVTSFSLGAQESVNKYNVDQRGLNRSVYQGDSLLSSYTVFKPIVILKGRYELLTQNGESKFSLKNARLGATGTINKYLSYYFLAEFAGSGGATLLDFFVTVKPHKRLSFNIGQYPLVIFNPYLISPVLLDFASATFMGQYVGVSRDIGLTATYTIKEKGMPITIDATVMNGSGLNNYKWTNSVAYGGKLSFGSLVKGFRTTAKAYKTKIQNDHFLFFGADLRYKAKQYKIEAEMMEKYNLDTKKYLSMAYIEGLYSIPLKCKALKSIDPVFRWDAMGYDISKEGFGVNRISTGASLVFNTGPFYTLLRLNYDHYFNTSYQFPEFTTAAANANMLTLELMVAF